MSDYYEFFGATKSSYNNFFDKLGISKPPRDQVPIREFANEVAEVVCDSGGNSFTMVPDFALDGNKVLCYIDKVIPVFQYIEFADDYPSFIVGGNNMHENRYTTGCYKNLYECFDFQIPFDDEIVPLSRLIEDFHPKFLDAGFDDDCYIPNFYTSRPQVLHFSRSTLRCSIKTMKDLIDLASRGDYYVEGSNSLPMFARYSSYKPLALIHLLLAYPNAWMNDEDQFTTYPEILSRMRMLKASERLFFFQRIYENWKLRDFADSFESYCKSNSIDWRSLINSEIKLPTIPELFIDSGKVPFDSDFPVISKAGIEQTSRMNESDEIIVESDPSDDELSLSDLKPLGKNPTDEETAQTLSLEEFKRKHFGSLFPKQNTAFVNIGIKNARITQGVIEKPTEANSVEVGKSEGKVEQTSLDVSEKRVEGLGNLLPVLTFDSDEEETILGEVPLDVNVDDVNKPGGEKKEETNNEIKEKVESELLNAEACANKEVEDMFGNLSLTESENIGVLGIRNTQESEHVGIPIFDDERNDQIVGGDAHEKIFDDFVDQEEEEHNKQDDGLNDDQKEEEEIFGSNEEGSFIQGSSEIGSFSVGEAESTPTLQQMKETLGPVIYSAVAEVRAVLDSMKPPESSEVGLPENELVAVDLDGNVDLSKQVIGMKTQKVVDFAEELYNFPEIGGSNLTMMSQHSQVFTPKPVKLSEPEIDLSSNNSFFDADSPPDEANFSQSSDEESEKKVIKEGGLTSSNEHGPKVVPLHQSYTFFSSDMQQFVVELNEEDVKDMERAVVVRANQQQEFKDWKRKKGKKVGKADSSASWKVDKAENLLLDKSKVLKGKQAITSLVMRLHVRTRIGDRLKFVEDFKPFQNHCYAESLHTLVRHLGVTCYDLFKDGKQHDWVEYWSKLACEYNLSEFGVVQIEILICSICAHKTILWSYMLYGDTNILDKYDLIKPCGCSPQENNPGVIHKASVRQFVSDFCFWINSLNMNVLRTTGCYPQTSLTTRSSVLGGIQYQGNGLSGHYSNEEPFNFALLTNQLAEIPQEFYLCFLTGENPVQIALALSRFKRLPGTLEQFLPSGETLELKTERARLYFEELEAKFKEG